MAEVADAELALLRNGFGLLEEMQRNPASKANLERAIKAVRPDVEIEEDIALRYAQPVQAKVDELSEKLTSFIDGMKAEREQGAQDRTVADLEAAFGRLTDAGYTEDGISKIKQMMVDRKIADPEAAVALFDKQNPPAQHEQAGWMPSNWDIASTASAKTDVAGLFKDEEAWADREAVTALNEIRLAKAA